MSWENDESLIGDDYLKIEVGENSFKLLDDGTKTKNSFGDYGVEFKVNEGKTLFIRQKPILKVLMEAKKSLGSLIGTFLNLTREGTKQDDTKYLNIRIDKVNDEGAPLKFGSQ